MDILLGLIVLALGLGVCFFGRPFFYFALPIWGFLVGFSLGATAIDQWTNDGFLATGAGIVLGILVGLLFAVLSYAFWWAGVLLLFASIGALLANGFMELINVNTDWVIAIAAILGAVAFGLLAWFLDMPDYVIIVGTAMAGAAAVITGVLLIFNQMDHEEFGNGIGWGIIHDHWYWFIPYFLLALVGGIFQLKNFVLASLPPDKWTSAQPA